MNSNFNDKDPWNTTPPQPEERQNAPQSPFSSVPPRKKRGHGGTAAALILIAVLVCTTAFFTFISHTDNSGSGGFSLNFSYPGMGAQEQASTTAPQPAATPDGVGTGGGDAKLAIVDVVPTPAPSMTADASGRAVLSTAQIAKKVTPSVVGILSSTSSQYGSDSSGSGIIMDAKGYIITNNHVVEGAQTITVVLDSGESYQAELVGRDSQSDIAVVKVDAQGLEAAEFGNSDALEAGDLAVAIGNPMGLELQSTVTAGIISAINRDIAINDRSMTMLQTDASINPGNSGGPLINRYGQVIGINTVKYVGNYMTYSEGLGFAIPINTAKPIIDELIERGYIKGRPAIGISGLRVDDRTRTFYDYPAGVLITEISEYSDAYAQGLRTGDIIVGVNGTAVSDMDEINAIKNKFTAGDTITLSIYRGGKVETVDVKLVDDAELAKREQN